MPFKDTKMGQTHYYGDGCKSKHGREYIQIISNISLHEGELVGKAYIGWLLNQVKNNVVYFVDDYGGHWKLQKLKG